jgi:hypothetical protein
VLFTAGDHVPEIPFNDDAGSDNGSPLQIGATCVNVGVMFGLTVTLIVAVVAHAPVVGVNVYVVVVVLLTAGDQVPVILLVDVVGSVNVPPLQMAANWVNVGVMFGLTVTLIVAVVAQTPTAGVKVYVVVVVLFTAGDQVPLIPFNEAVGSVNDPPLQIAATCVNVGVIGWFTVTDIVAVVAQVPTAGVKVYVVVAVLFTAGDHVPAILLFEEVGSVNDPPLQIGAIWVNVGVTGWFTVTLIVAVVAHWPAVGVNV